MQIQRKFLRRLCIITNSREIYLKEKESTQLVSAANQLKLTAADGKKYTTDTFVQGIDYSYYYEQEDFIAEDE